MVRFAFVIATLGNGGAERTVSNIVTHLPEGYEADIVLNDTSSIVYPYKGRIISLNMKPKVDKVNLWYQFKVLIKRIYVLWKLKRKNNYEAVLSFSDSASVANILSGNKYCKVIVSVRNNLTKSEKSKAYKYVVNPLAGLLYNKADKVVAISKGTELDLIENIGISTNVITTIYNGLDSQIVSENMQIELSDVEKSWVDGKNILVTMGRLVEQKGQWHLIRALKMLKDKGMDFKLLILGEGELKDYLVELTQKLNLTDNVVFCGFCKNPFKILKEADLCIFPSMYEGFGNTLVEAMCCGVPCISTDYDSGAREILAPTTDIKYKNTDQIEYAQYGVIVPVCDGKHYCGEDVLTKEEKLMGQAIYEMLTSFDTYCEYKVRQQERVAQLDINKIVQEWLAVIKE